MHRWGMLHTAAEGETANKDIFESNLLDENRDDNMTHTPFTFLLWARDDREAPCGAHGSTVEAATTVAYTSGAGSATGCAGAALSSCISIVESATTVAYTRAAAPRPARAQGRHRQQGRR